MSRFFPDNPVWFITGASSGLGLSLAKATLAAGWRTVLAVRRPEAVKEIAERYPELALVVRLDVNDSAQASKALGEASRRFGYIDILVNNAGYGYLAAVEEGEDHEIRALFDTNFFSAAALTRLVLPGLRALGRGYVINISSVGGLVGMPGSAYYAASKFALEGFSDALAAELAPLGIGVLLVEPGPFRTEWAGSSMRQSPRFIEAYEQTAGQRRRQIGAGSGKQPGDPDKAAASIIAVLRADNTPRRLLLGSPGLANARAKLNAVLKDIDEWESLARSADYV